MWHNSFIVTRIDLFVYIGICIYTYVYTYIYICVVPMYSANRNEWMRESWYTRK